jgi:hypothetical protein
MSTPSEEACGARLVRPEYLTESGYQDRAAALELIGARSRTFVTPMECGANLALVHHRLVFSRLHVPSEKCLLCCSSASPPPVCICLLRVCSSWLSAKWGHGFEGGSLLACLLLAHEVQLIGYVISARLHVASIAP